VLNTRLFEGGYRLPYNALQHAALADAAYTSFESVLGKEAGEHLPTSAVAVKGRFQRAASTDGIDDQAMFIPTVREGHGSAGDGPSHAMAGSTIAELGGH